MIACIAVLAGCDRLPGKPTAAERPLRPSEVTDFATLYGRNCAGCHGADGRLGAARPLNDPVYLALAGRERLVELTAAGVPGTPMPGFAGRAGGMLTDDQIAILAEGMLARWGRADALGGVAAPAYAADGGGDPRRGAAVYATYCAACHGPEGRGGEKGGAVVDPSYLALVSNQALRTAVLCGRPDLGMPDWRALVPDRSMSDQEITDVVAWLTSHRSRVEQ